MQDEKQKVALGSIVASGGLTVAKAIVGVLTGSLAILSEAAHSLIDFFATVMTYFAVRISGKPADEEHHYGHGKVESISALAETALLFVLSRRGDLGGGAAAVGRPRPRGRGDGLGLRGHRRFDRGRFLPRAAALSRRQRNRERGAGGRRAAFRLRHVVVDRGAGRPWRAWPSACPGRMRRRRWWSRCSCASPAGGWPPHHRHADRHRAGGRRRHGPRGSPRASPAWSRSSACGCGRSATSCSSRSWRR